MGKGEVERKVRKKREKVYKLNGKIRMRSFFFLLVHVYLL